MARLAGDADVIIGVDTHLDSHAAAACSTAGRELAQTQIPATPAGYAQLLAWARAVADGGQLAWAVEGTRSYVQAWPATWLPRVSRSRRSTAAVTWASGGLARATRLMPSAPPASCSPARMQRRCAPTGTARRCGCC
jgi:hypothetical protein